MPLTREAVERLLESEEKATASPWDWDKSADSFIEGHEVGVVRQYLTKAPIFGEITLSNDNREFIIKSRNLVRELAEFWLAQEHNDVPLVPVPKPHREAAERFDSIFQAVPLTAAERKAGYQDRRKWGRARMHHEEILPNEDYKYTTAAGFQAGNNRRIGERDRRKKEEKESSDEHAE